MAVVRNVDLKGRAGAHKGMVVLTFTIPTATEAVDQNVFVCDQAYQVVSVEEAHSGAGGSGAQVEVVRCIDTDTPAGGSKVTAAVMDLTTAINTVVNAALNATVSRRQLATGNRLALNFGGTVAGLEGAAITVILIPNPDKRYWLSNA